MVKTGRCCSHAGRGEVCYTGPLGPIALVYNCACAVRAVVKGISYSEAEVQSTLARSLFLFYFFSLSCLAP